ESKPRTESDACARRVFEGVNVRPAERDNLTALQCSATRNGGSASSVEEESGRVDQRRGQVLHAVQALVRDLDFRRLDILAQLHELRIETDRFLGTRDRSTTFENA